MLKKSFVHIKGINREKEKAIWGSGINSWEELLECDEMNLPFSLKESVRQEIAHSITHFEKGNLDYFEGRLPKNQYWRIYPHLKHKCCFLDIETTGLSRSEDIITIIGVYDGKESKVFVDGKNMHLFAKEIAKYDLVITFNGSCFDLPFIKSKYSDINLPKFHVDLRYALKNLGYCGGLKLIEQQLGYERDENIKDVDGFEAVRLWKAYKKGDKNALAKLIDYNTSDIENLKPLMDFAYENLCKECSK